MFSKPAHPVYTDILMSILLIIMLGILLVLAHVGILTMEFGNKFVADAEGILGFLSTQYSLYD
jgi:hypothetical protein